MNWVKLINYFFHKVVLWKNLMRISMARTIGVYINADDIKRSSLCSDSEVAVKLKS